MERSDTTGNARAIKVGFATLMPAPRAQKKHPAHALPKIPTQFVDPCAATPNAPIPSPDLPRSCAQEQHTLPLAVARSSLTRASARRVWAANVMASRWSIVRELGSEPPCAAAVVTGVHHARERMERTPRELSRVLYLPIRVLHALPRDSQRAVFGLVPPLSERGPNHARTPACHTSPTRLA